MTPNNYGPTTMICGGISAREKMPIKLSTKSINTGEYLFLMITVLINTLQPNG